MRFMNTPKHKNGRRLLAMMIAAMLLVCLPVLALAGTYAGSKLSGVNKYIYDTVKAQIKNVADGTESSAEVTIPLWDYDGLTLPEGVVFDTDNSGAKIAVMPVTYGGATEPLKTTFVNNKVSEEVRGYMGAAQTNLMKALGVDLLAVINALRTDCPYELYWATTESSRSLGSVNGSLAKSEGEELYTVTEFYAYGDVMIAFTVDKKFRSGSDSYTVDTTTTAAAHNEIESAVSSIISKYASASDYDKLLGYTKEICDRVSYNNEARDSINSLNNNSDYDPWSLHSVFDSSTTSNPVCEGYTEAFQYLCDRTNFSGNVACYTVTGNLSGGVNGDVGGPHAWNVITIGGKNYIADVTNSDDGQAGHIDGAAQPYDLVLAGVTGSWDGSYTYSHNTATSYGKGVFTYDAETRKLYGEDILTLESTKYVPKTPLAAPTVTANPFGDANGSGFTVKWTGVTGAAQYKVALYCNGTLVESATVAADLLTWTLSAYSGEYYATVTAIADENSGYADSAPAKTTSHTFCSVTWTQAGNQSFGQYYLSGNQITKPHADPGENPGYLFKGWTLDANGAGEVIDFAATPYTVTSNVTFYPKWERTAVTLTATAPTFADVTYGYAEAAGQTVTITNTGNIAASGVTYALSSNDAFTVSGGDTTIAVDGSTGVTVTPKTGLGAGTYTAQLAVKLNGSTAATADISFTVNPATLTVDASNVKVVKAYDGTTNAGALSGDLTVTGKIGTDDVTVTATPGAYADANVGTGKSVTLSLALSGAAAGNYALGSESLTVTTGEITKAAANAPVVPTPSVDGTNVTVTNVTAGQKYMILPVGSAEPTAVSDGWQDSGEFTGLDPNTNYIVYTYAPATETHEASGVAASATLTTGRISVSADMFTVDELNKTYTGSGQSAAVSSTSLAAGTDYTVSYAVNGTGALDDSGLPVNAGEYTVSITGMGNYTGTLTYTMTIAPKTITASAEGLTITKTYDGTTAASATGSVTLSGTAAGDTVEAAYTLGEYDDAYAGSGKSVSVTVTLSGTDAANYVLASSTIMATGDITAAAQTLSSSHTTEASAYSLMRGGKTVDLSTLVSSNASGAEITFDNLSANAATLNGSELTSHETNTGTVSVQASAGAVDLNGDSVNEYNAASAITIYVNVTEKNVGSLTVTQSDIQYGETISPTVTLPDGTAVTDAALTYTDAAGNKLDVPPVMPGSYTVTATYETKDTVYTGSALFNITQADVAVSVTFVNVDNLVYNGKAHEPAVTVEFTMLRAQLAEGTDYTVSYESNVSAGTAYAIVTPVPSSTYAFETVRAPFSIAPAPLTVTASIEEKVYDGTTVATVSGLTFEGLVSGDAKPAVDAAAAFADAYAGSSKPVTVTLTAGSTLTNYTVPATITAAGSITAAPQSITAATPASLVRGGQTLDLTTLVSTEAGDKAVFTFDGLTGDAATLSGSILTSDATKTGSVTVTAHAAAADLNGDNIPEYDAAADAVLTIEVTEKPVVAGGLTVTQGDVLVGTAYDPAVAMADGSALAGGTLTLTYTGSDGVVLAEKPSALGAYAISAKYETATTIYTGSATFKIHNILDGVLVDMAETAVTYNGEEQKPAVNVTCTVPGITLAEGVDYTVTYANNINASANTATATVKPVEGARYTFDAKQIAFTINPAPLTVEAGTLKVTKAFDGTTAPGTMTGEAALTGLFRNDDVTAAVTAGDYADANAGTGKDVTFSVTISGVMAPNYTLTSKTFVAPVGEITPVETMDVPQSAILAFNDTFAKTYDLNAMLANMSLTGAPVFEVAGYDSALLAGVQAEGGVLTYALKPGMAKPDAPVTTDIAVTVTGLTNVKTLNVTLTLTLTPEPLTIDTTGITLNGKPFGSEPIAYNGQPIAFTGAASIPGYTGEFAYTWFNAANGEQLTEAPKDAGSYTLRISIPNDPSITAELPVTIAPAVITIKGASLGMEVGGTVPALNETSYTVTGLMPGDALTVLPTVAYAAEPNILAPGVVEIVVSGAQASANYTIEYVNGVLNIGGEPILPPAFTAPETDVIISVEAGSQATLTVVSPNADSYQWYINRGSGYVAIEGATSPTYVTTPVNIKNDGFTYYCEATNLAGKANSPVFTLKVFEVPKTGDEATPLAWMSLMLLSAVGIVISRKRRSENR